MAQPLHFDIVLPCYNPIEGWVEMIDRSLTMLEDELNFRPHVILVDDGSSKGISAADVEQLEKLGIQIIRSKPNQGKGAALRIGINTSQAERIIFTDVDFPYTIPSIIKVAESLHQGADLVVGVRDKSYYKSVPAMRRLISKSLRNMMRLVLRIPVDDTQAGLKGVSKTGRDIFLATTTNRYLFDLELIVMASRQEEVDVQAVEVELREGVVFSSLSLSILFSEFMNLLKIVWRATFS